MRDDEDESGEEGTSEGGSWTGQLGVSPAVRRECLQAHLARTWSSFVCGFEDEKRVGQGRSTAQTGDDERARLSLLHSDHERVRMVV